MSTVERSAHHPAAAAIVLAAGRGQRFDPSGQQFKLNQKLQGWRDRDSPHGADGGASVF